jgi:MGT family glycosyltransferase
MSCRVLFTSWPFVGHLTPQLGLAGALRDRGDEVAFYAGPSVAPKIAAEGYEVFPFERLDERRAQRAVAALEERDQKRRPSPALVRRVFHDWLVETIPDQLADLEPVLDRWRPDALVTDLAFWSPVVVLWERRSVPVAMFPTFMGPLIPGPDAPPWGIGYPPPRTALTRLLAGGITRAVELGGRGLRRRVDEIRAENGLGPLGCTVNQYAARLPLSLVGNIPELDYNRRDLPATVKYVGDCTWRRPSEGVESTWLDSVPDSRPWVHVVEGTLHSGDPFILRAAARGLANRPLEAILSTGGVRSPADLRLGSVAENIHLAGWVDHDVLLPRCRVVVTAGGASTIVSALRSGVPLVVVPTTWDKPDNARRVTDAGVGVRLSPRRCTPEGLRAAVEQVLDDPRIAARARNIGELIRRERGAAHAAELVEAIAVHPPTVHAPQSARVT